ncbi:FAD binding domain-containing protein [Suillus cothurnatus]|nr:FAD binding domain-containing protein [Suillus cothurnatus]
MSVSFVSHSEVDVLIIGAGPAGSLNVRIVDKRSGGAFKLTTGEGDGLSPRSVEVLQSYGLADRLLKEACQVHQAAFYNPSSTGGIELTNRTLNVTAPSARYPFEVALHQGAVQDIFLDSMTPLSKDESELTDPTSYPVRVVLERLDKFEDGAREEIVHAKFVVGCDGAHSWIRKQVDITMDGEQSDSIWGVVDMVTPDTDFPDVRNKAFVHSNHGSVILVSREQDRIRVYVQLEDKDVINPVTGRVDKEKMGPDQILKTAQKSLEPYKLIRKSEFLWWTLYSVGQRVASKFSIENRIFIAGGCLSHTLSKSSINDTHNLAWKIALVVRGWADMPLLSTYESERRKFALDLIAFDKLWSTLVCGCRTFQTDFTSGIGIHYQPSVAVNDRNQELASGLVLGKRVPPCKFMRAADVWPFELQDLLPSDFSSNYLFSLVISAIRSSKPGLSRCFLNRYATHGSSRFDIITISKGRKETFNIFRLPTLLRSHWSNFGGEGYSYYGVGAEGALVAIRPDGYVGAIAPLDHVEDLDAYFASFMKIPA